MENIVLDQRARLFRSDAKWLLLAIVLHAMILSVPVSKLTPGAFRKGSAVVVRLLSAREIVSPNAPPVETPERPNPEARIRENLSEEPVVLPAPSSDFPAPASLPDQSEDAPQVSTARLLDSRNDLFRSVPRADSRTRQTRRLGSPVEQTPPQWLAGPDDLLAPVATVFSDAIAPDDVEIIDRWLAADGSHNVIIETPNGLRLCGRAPAWDPTQPLVEHVMMFHVCGGDQRDNFEFVRRERFDHFYRASVAKDTTEP